MIGLHTIGIFSTDEVYDFYQFPYHNRLRKQLGSLQEGMTQLRLAVLVYILLAINKVRCKGCGEVDQGCTPSLDLAERSQHRHWPAIFAKVFESVSSKNLGEMNMILARHMEYVRKVIRPRCSLKFHTSQGVRDLTNKDCLIDETFIRLMILSSKLRCSNIECLNPGSSRWNSKQFVLLRGRMLMWLDIATSTIEHGKEVSLDDRHSIANAILDDIYALTKTNNIKGLEKYLHDTRLPSLQQMEQVKASCDPNARWENDLACPWKNLLDELFTLTKTYNGRYAKNKQISTSIDYNKKLELQNFRTVIEAAAIKTRENLDKFSVEIERVINDNFDKLSDYFKTLASYDADIAEADLSYIEGALAKFKRKEVDLNDKLDKIAQSVAGQTQGAALLDSFSAWMKVVASTVATCFDPSGAMDTWDRLDEAAASTVNTIRATTLPKLMKDVKADLKLVKSAFDKNRGLLNNAMDIVRYKEDSDDTIDINAVRKRFLTAYQNYDPQVTTADIARLDQKWINVLEVIKDSLGDMTQAAASAVKGKIFASNKIEEMAYIIPQITSLFESRFEYQFDLMDTLAVSLRAKLAKDSVQKLSDSIKSMRDNSHRKIFDKKQAALYSLITSRIHTIQAVQLHCNSLEYRNAGEMPSVCIDALQSLSDSAISDVIAYLPQTCVVNTQNGVYVSIPASKTARKGTVNLQDLYRGKKTSFQIPDSQWLVDNGWVRTSEAQKNVFYVKGFELFLVSLDEASKGRHLGVDITARSSGPLMKDRKRHIKFSIQPAPRYSFSYKENIPPCDKKAINPYQLCQPLSDICVVHNGLLENKYDMYPSIFSEFEMEVPDLDGNTEVPEFFENELFLQAKVTLCSKTPSIKPSIHIREKPLQISRTQCSSGQYFDRLTNLWKQCPTGSNASLGGYYCLPGKSILMM